MAITYGNSDAYKGYECTYICNEDRFTECQYFGNICEQCIHFKKKGSEIMECPFLKDECINPTVLCEDCFLINADEENVYFDEIDDEDIITFINFDIEDLPF